MIFDDKDLPRFVTEKGLKFSVKQEELITTPIKRIRMKTPMLRSDLCEFSDAYIVLKGTITAEQNVNRNNDGNNKPFIFKNNAPFINCISKINGVLIDNTEDLDVVMPMCILIEYSKNYTKQRKVCGIITEINQIMMIKEILSHLSTKQVLQEIHKMTIIQ